MTTPAALGKWQARNAREETLPSGARVKVAKVGALDAAVAGILPASLMSAALGPDGHKPEAGDAVDQAVARDPLDMIRMMRALAAVSIRSVYDEDADTWEDVRLEANAFDMPGLFPPEDIEALIELVDVDGGGTDDLAPFREVGAGDVDRPGGEVLAGAAVGAPGDPGRSDRAPRRRGARPSPPPR